MVPRQGQEHMGFNLGKQLPGGEQQRLGSGSPGTTAVPGINKGLDLGWERGFPLPPPRARQHFGVLVQGEVVGRRMGGLVIA